jgi:hypothetical protein
MLMIRFATRSAGRTWSLTVDIGQGQDIFLGD